jgi:F-type H+-transporting ATPase subunit b|tara:strand:+ start:125 stop:703 length:579 start_codon:yes stop_codon:yes gene_type:complete
MKKLLVLILVLIVTSNKDLFAAEAGMPQLDPKYWASQTFWLILIFSALYISISNFFLPKIKDSLNDRENKIKDDLDEAKNLKELADKKREEYLLIMENAKSEIVKIIVDSKSKLDLDIQKKKEITDKEIETELRQAQKEIENLKQNSIKDIALISRELTSKIIEDISGDKMNESSIKAAVSEISKNDMERYL